MQKVLFLCTGNSCRSQMAEGFLKQYRDFEVYSAGTKPSSQVDPLANAVMRELDIDISGQVPRSVENFLKDEFDYVITVCDDAKESCPIFLGKVKHRLHFGFADPAGRSLDFFRNIRDEIKLKINEFQVKITEDK